MKNKFINEKLNAIGNSISIDHRIGHTSDELWQFHSRCHGDFKHHETQHIPELLRGGLDAMRLQSSNVGSVPGCVGENLGGWQSVDMTCHVACPTGLLCRQSYLGCSTTCSNPIFGLTFKYRRSIRV